MAKIGELHLRLSDIANAAGIGLKVKNQLHMGSDAANQPDDELYAVELHDCQKQSDSIE
jgi:hypothetical protein